MSFDHPYVLVLLPLLIFLLILRRYFATRHPTPRTSFLLIARAFRLIPEPPKAWNIRWREVGLLVPPAFAILGLAGPRRHDPEGEVRGVIVMDRSASMATASDGASRWQRGLKNAREILGKEARIVAMPPSTFDEAALEPGLAWTDAATLARIAKGAHEEGARVLTVTDKPDFEPPEGTGCVRVGDAAKNRGIVAAGIGEGGRLLVRVEGRAGAGAGAGAGGIPPKVTILRGGEAGHQAPIDLPPESGPGRWIVDLPALGGEDRVAIDLEDSDANPLDNHVVLIAGERPLRVGLPLEGVADLERAFAALPGVETFRGEGPAILRVAASAPDESPFHLLLPPAAIDGLKTTEPKPASGRLRAVSGFSFSGTDELSLPAVYGVESVTDDVLTLLAIGEIPLLVRKGSTLLLLQVPEESRWPSRRSFPLLIADVIATLEVRPATAPRAIPGGNFVRVAASGPHEAVLVDPSGRRRGLAGDPRGVFSFELEMPGIHRLEARDPARNAAGWPKFFAGAVLSTEVTCGPFAVMDVIVAPPPAQRVSRSIPLVAACAVIALLALILLPGPTRTILAGLPRSLKRTARPGTLSE